MRWFLSVATFFIIILCFFNASAATDYIYYDGFEEIPTAPQAWEISISPAATNASVAAGDGALVLEYNTTTSAVGRAEITTHEIEFTESLMYIHLSFDFEGFADNSLRALEILGDNPFYKADLFKLTGTGLAFFGTLDNSYELSQGEKVELTFAINFTDRDNVYGIAFLNGVEKYRGSINFNKNINLQRMKLKIRNTSVGGAILESKMRVYGLQLSSIDEFSVDFNVKNNDFINYGEMEELILSYEGVPSNTMFEKDNYELKVENDQVQINIEFEEGKIKIIPIDGWQPFLKYSLKINFIGDIFHQIKEENIVINFTLIPEGISLPILEFDKNQKTTFKEGEEISITVYITDGDFDSILFTVNGEEMGVFAESPATLTFSCQAGEYAVQAAAKVGEYIVNSESLLITVTENTAPSVRFKNYEGSISVALGEMKTIEIEAADEDGIAKILVYLNGSLICELDKAPYMADLSMLNIGTNNLKAVAIDALNKRSEVSIDIKVYAMIVKELLNESEFTSYKDATTLTSGIIMRSQRGFVETRTIDPEYGMSLLVGMETVNDAYSETNLPFINIPTGGNKNRFVFECDVYVSENGKEETSGDKRISLKKDGSTDFIVVRFTDKMNFLSTELDYETQTWYHIKLDVNIAEGTLDAYLNGEQILSNAALHSELDCVDFIRLYGPRYDDVPAYTAIDNIEIRALYDVPEITEIGSDGIVSIDDESFELYLSHSLYPSSVNINTVFLIDEDGEQIELKDVTWDDKENKIVITPKALLLSNSVYRVIIDKTAKLDKSTEVGYDISSNFITEMKGLEVAEVIFTKQGTDISAEISLCNVDLPESEFYIVLTLWQDNKYIGKTIQHKILKEGETVKLALTKNFPTGARAELYVYDSLAAPEMLAKKVYVYN